MHRVFALLCFVVVIHWLIFPYPTGLLHWHCGNLTIAPVPAKQPWWIWINTSCEFIMNDCITTTKQSTTKPCAYFLGYTVPVCMVGLTTRTINSMLVLLIFVDKNGTSYASKLWKNFSVYNTRGLTEIRVWMCNYSRTLRWDAIFIRGQTSTAVYLDYRWS